jgi:polyvinyl alcohol dehydrogenase (cytochrome)
VYVGLVGLTSLVLGAAALTAPATAAVTSTDWPGYLDGPMHSSYNAADTTITPTNVSQLVRKWKWRGDPATMPGQPGPAVYASPTVADGSIYIGANNGYFYQLNATTGAVQHKVFIGYRPKLTCSARGFISTAAVAADPSDGQDTVYVGAPDGYLYAFDAATLTQKWRSVIDIPSLTQNDYFQWSSPTVANGKIYIGSASHCDKPLTRGEVIAYDQGSGTELARHYTVPLGFLGGGVWSSVAVGPDGSVYATSGTQPKGTTNRYESVSILRLDGTTLATLGKFTVPNSELGGDGDFGGSPTIFGSMVGACNKNGIYYALDRLTMQLQWEKRMGAKSSSSSPAQCSAAAIWDGTSLYFAADGTTINGVAYAGSIRKVNPANGAFLWQTGLPNSVLGSPTMNGSGVIGVATYDSEPTPNAQYLVRASDGTILRTLTTGGMNFGQMVFADGTVYGTNVGQGLMAWRLP